MGPIWTGAKVVCIASGPSLTPEDCELAEASGRKAIVTNTTFRNCLWADVLYGFDAAWWRLYIDEVKSKFGGLLFSKSPSVRRLGVECAVRNPAFHSFGQSGTDAIALAAAFGARDIVLLGYDCQLTNGQSHHHGDHPQGLENCGSIGYWPKQFERLARYLSSIGVSVKNATRSTALTAFDRVPLEECL